MRATLRLSVGHISSTLFVVALTFSATLDVAAQEREAAPRVEERAENVAVAQEPSTQRPDTFTPSRSAIETQRATARARFIRGDVTGALDALNLVGEPVVSSVAVDGLILTRRRHIDDYLGIAPGELLTGAQLARATRRVQAFPMASSGTVRYDLMPDAVVLRPIISERDRFPEGINGWVPVGVRAIFTQEVRFSVANPLGGSEVWTPSIRWAQGRPRVALQIEAPAPGVLPGVVRVDTLWARTDYLVSAQPRGIFQEERFHAGAALTDWLTGWLRWEGGGSIERIETVTYAGLNGMLNGRLLRDHVSITVLTGWFGSGGAESFQTGEFSVAARLTTRDDQPMLSGIAGLARVSSAAPLAMWPAGSTGSGQTAVLRAHRLNESGLVTGEAFGRDMVFAAAEYEHPIPTMLGPGAFKLAGFVDTAQARQRLHPTDSEFLVDIGAGVRINTSRTGTSRVRLDFGYGLTDGRKRISAGYVRPWGER